MKKVKILKGGDVRDILDQYDREEISYSRMVEMLNEKIETNLEELLQTLNLFKAVLKTFL